MTPPRTARWLRYEEGFGWAAGTDDLDGFHEGDGDVFRALVRKHGGQVLRIAESFAASRDEAEDLFQDVWLRVYDKRAHYSGSGPFVVWLLTVAKNTCRSRYRRDQARKQAHERLRSSEILENAAWSTPVQLEVEHAEARAWLYQAILELTDRERTAIVLCLFEHRSSPEAAQMMDCEPATVRSLMRNGVTRLKQVVEEGGREGF